MSTSAVATMATAHDGFTERFLERVPAEVGRTFTPAQLDAVKLAFGARTWGAHAVDLRRSVGLGPYRFYIVLLMGRARRDADSRNAGVLGRLLVALAHILVDAARSLRRVAIALILVLCVGGLGLGGMAMLYVGKRALGIDVFEGIDMLPDKQIEELLR